MIKANELRIGNYIDGYHSPYDRGQVTAEYFSTVDADGFIDGEPVELTEEILIKAGFADVTSEPNFNGISLDIYNNQDYWFAFSLGDKGANIKYLHQLQNLYFALTGEELNIQL